MRAKLTAPLRTWRSLSVEARASAAYFACSVLQKGLSLITLPLFARMLTKVEYGQATIYDSWSALLTIFVTLNLGYGSFNTAMIRFEGERRRYLAAVDGVVATLGALFVLMYLPLRGVLSPIFELPTWVMLLMAAHIVASSSLQCWYALERFEFRYRNVVAVTLGVSVLGVACALAMVLASPERGYARILGTALPSVAVGLALAARCWARERTFFDRDLWRFALGFNLPLVPYYVSQMLFNQSDRIMISHMVGTGAAAEYGIAYQLAILLTFVLNAINGSYVPWLFVRIRDGRARENRGVAAGIAALMAGLLLCVIAVAPEAILVLASEKYAEAKWVVGPVAMSLIFHFYAQLFVNFQFYYEEKWLLVAGAAAAGVANVALNWLLIPAFGYVAAGYTTLLSFFLMAAMNWAMYRVVLRRRGLADEMFDYRAMAGIAALLMALGFALMALYDAPVARYAFVAALAIVGATNKKRLVGLVSSIRKRGAGDGPGEESTGDGSE